jgi:hypothetical protein
MPILFPPGDDVLIALGKMTLQFAELEYWVNTGIVEAEHITALSDQEKVSGVPFSIRIPRLITALAGVEARGWITFGQDVVPAVDFLPLLLTLADDRNDFFHGAAFTLMTKSAPHEVHHRKFNPKTGRHHALDKVTLDGLTARIEKYTEQLKFAILDLCCAKQAKQIGSLTWG